MFIVLFFSFSDFFEIFRTYEAKRALLWWLRTFVNITAYKAFKFLFHISKF